MITENILQYIPQRPPFVMVDALLYADVEKATANLTITSDNIFSEDDFFSEAGLLENIAQTVAAGNGYNQQQANKEVSGGYIAGVKNFRVFFLPKVKDVLTTDIVITEKIFNMTTIAGKIFCNNELVAQCEMKIFSNSND
jgi:predicted hotdog family 3-hydroxylacyl-ACP dehydratase